LTHNSTGWHQRPWIHYSDREPTVRMAGAPPGLQVFGTSGFGKPTWTNVWGTSLSCPLFAAGLGVVEENRRCHGGIVEILDRFQGQSPTVPELIAELV